MNILVVETNADIIEGIKLSFNSHLADWSLSVTDSGFHCLNMVKNGHRPDLVILGSRFSDKSALELLADIREDSDLPVVILSQNKNICALVKCFESGADDYITEPFNEAIFAAKLKAIIRRRGWVLKTS